MAVYWISIGLQHSSFYNAAYRRGEVPSPIAMFIHVQVFLAVRSASVINNAKPEALNPQIINLSLWSHVDPKIRTSGSYNLSNLSRNVIFASLCSLALQSTFLVYFASDDSNTLLHLEISSLKCLSSPTKQSGWLYASEIAPDFWDTLCSSLGKFILSS